MPKVLIVEDDLFVSDLYQKVFTREGIEVQLATDGQEALETLKTFVPDIILLDVMMPRLNGFDTLVQIKQNDAIKHIPVFMLSNLADESNEAEAQAKGAVKYLIKSQHVPSEIITIVKDYLYKNTQQST